MRLNQSQDFIAVAEGGSIRAAARTRVVSHDFPAGCRAIADRDGRLSIH